MRSAVVAALLIVAMAMPSARAQYIYNGSVVAPSAFVTLAASDLSALASDLPYLNINAGVDTSSWTEYDVTIDGATLPGGTCANMSAASVDNSVAFDCWMRLVGDSGLLYFPDGTYLFGSAQLDGIANFRPRAAFDNRGIRCQSRSATLRTIGDNVTPVNLWESEDIVLGTPRSWSAGTSRGSTVLTVSTPGDFSTGSWVRLTADPNSVQDGTQRVHYTRVSSVGGSTITIDRPLPSDFTGANAQATLWTPTENMVIENCTLDQLNPDHQLLSLNFLLSFKSDAGTTLRNVHFSSAYQFHMLLQNTARILITGSDFSDQRWDKPFNGYSIKAERTSDLTLIDGHMEGSVQTFACSSGGQGTVIALMDIRSPLDNQPAFDRGCNGGTGNTCTQVSHGHALHCSSNAGDLAGTTGDSACRGTRADVISGSILQHDSSCSETSVIRNYIEPQAWIDFNNGPGRNQLYYGNTFRAGTAISADGATGNPGDFAVKTNETASLPAGYRRNPIWASNTINHFGFGGGFNRLGDGMRVLDMVMRGGCTYNNSSGDSADGGLCTQFVEAGRGGVNDVFTNNTIGSNAHSGGYTRTMPSFPGLTAWPIATDGDEPWVGPELGDPSTATGCLPAAKRWNGGSCP